MILSLTTSHSFPGTAPDSSNSFLLQPPRRWQVVAFLPFITPLFASGKAATQTDAINHRYQFPHHAEIIMRLANYINKRAELHGFKSIQA